MSVEAIRNQLAQILQNQPEWDKRVMNVQVTNATERFKEIRILVTSEDSSRNWDLRVAVREKLIEFININYPGAFARIRVQEMT